MNRLSTYSSKRATFDGVRNGLLVGVLLVSISVTVELAARALGFLVFLNAIQVVLVGAAILGLAALVGAVTGRRRSVAPDDYTMIWLGLITTTFAADWLLARLP